MTEQSFYVKRGGRIFGPFSSSQLRRAAAQGELETGDEVSKNRNKWVLASTVKGLSFSERKEGAPTPDGSDAQQAVDGASEWYYRVMGHVFGPVSLAEMKRLLLTGGVAFDSWVREGTNGDWRPAEAIRELLPCDGPSSAIPDHLLIQDGCPAAQSTTEAKGNLENALLDPTDTLPSGTIGGMGKPLNPVRWQQTRSNARTRLTTRLLLTGASALAITAVLITGLIVATFFTGRRSDEDVAEQRQPHARSAGPQQAQERDAIARDPQEMAVAALVEQLGGEVVFGDISERNTLIGVSFDSWSLINDETLESLKALTHLKSIRITRGSTISSRRLLPKRLSPLPEYCTGLVSDEGLEHIRDLTSLSVLVLDNADVSDSGLNRIRGLTALKTLNLAHSRITDAGLEHLGGMIALESLDLSDTGISADGLGHLRGLVALRDLNLDFTPAASTEVTILKGLSSLQSLGIARKRSGSRMFSFSSPDTRNGMVWSYAPDAARGQGLADVIGLRRLNLSGLNSSRGYSASFVVDRLEREFVPISLLADIRKLQDLDSLDLSNTKIGSRTLAFLFAAEEQILQLPGIKECLRETPLITVDLSRTGLQGAPAADLNPVLSGPGLQRVRSLILSRTEVDDDGLQFLSGLSNLRTLELDETKVTDKGLEHLKGLTGLEELSLRWNKTITAAGVAQLKNMTKLRSLRFAGAPIGDHGLRDLTAMTKLEELSLVWTDISDAGLEHLIGLKNLRSLDLVSNGLDGSGLRHLAGLSNLQVLNLHSNPLKAGSLKPLAALDKLEWLNLWFTGVTDADMEYVSQMRRLRLLTLPNPVSDAGLAKLKGLSKLQNLDLEGCRITNAGLEHLMGMPNLRVLNLFATDVTDAGLHQLRRLTNLQVLNLGHTRITDVGLPYVGGLSQLQELSLSGTDATDEGLRHLYGLARLRRIKVGEFRDDLGRYVGMSGKGVELFRLALPSCQINP